MWAMKYIIFSDVHSNLEAVKAFCQAVESIDHDKKVCLGDIVGYNADPNLVIEWICSEVDIVLAGNHDYAVLKKTDLNYFNSFAYQACAWTRGALKKENKEFLEGLPIEKEGDDIYWVHSSPLEPTKWHYVSTLQSAVKNFDYFEQTLCFLGHSHLPSIFEKDKNNKIHSLSASNGSLKIELDPESRYIVNVGSLGQPRDGNSNPVFVIYDTDRHIIEFQRFSYNLSLTQEKIIGCGLPQALAARLADGR